MQTQPVSKQSTYFTAFQTMITSAITSAVDPMRKRMEDIERENSKHMEDIEHQHTGPE